MKITSPLSVSLPRKTKADRKIYLNLNVYRNLHYIVNNQAKEIYNELMKPYLSGLKFKGPISLTFQLFKKTRRKTDRSNILSIVEKFFCDALVHYGCIPDDNDDHITSTNYLTGGIDSENPRVEIEIKQDNKKNEP